jgi:post-segregation antitoxin (ccd killing protein)
MTTLELTVTLPDDLAQRAQSAGLLTSEAIESMLCEQLRKQAGESLRATWARAPREELTPEIEQEIVEQVRAVRRK